MSSQPQACLWLDQSPAEPRWPPLAQSARCDVAVIGGGYTGLWTAYYLKRMAPELEVALLEAESCGWGASGRNGGWLIGGLAGQEAHLRGLDGERREQARRRLFGIVDEVAAVLAREGIECDFAHGGVLYAAARYPEQEAAGRRWLRELRRAGHGEADFRWLEREEAQSQLGARDVRGGVFSPHCAVIQPARLAQGLARAAARLGVRIHERSPVRRLAPGVAGLDGCELRADVIVPALEGAANQFPLLGRCLLPVQSLLLATEPLPAALWEEIGLARRQAFGDLSRMVTYGQRSADGRLVFGARGGYRLGGRAQWDFDPDGAEFAWRERLLRQLFPALGAAAVQYRWGGTLGVARAFTPYAMYDRRAGIAMAGGYGGEGVGAANLMGRTLAEWILERDGDLTSMPWVVPEGRLERVRRWAPEPVPWLGYHLLRGGYALEERLCAGNAAPAWARRGAGRLAAALESLLA
ncbi:FAD-dependent oxidoreductase [Chromobacterium sp. LK11]|uniref:NAD(P)/FAD-dependent oxidoreductase n=1 Tax=Chromobacterium sp. LK11 TaxID=1628212 RepID=UPI0006544E7D|nr:FAD-dependent oxidoreductase [Chromobacterium sp. LK11]KMN82174.1 FAD-dependent oxidoreductase [Chromobacterium sp. LK11]